MVMVLESADRSQRIPLDRESIFVGRSEWKSDICLDDSGVADVHCELMTETQGIRVVAMTDSGVTVNGQVVREATLVTGDELGIAEFRFRLLNNIDGQEAGSARQDDSVIDETMVEEPKVRNARIDDTEVEETKVEEVVPMLIDPKLCRWLVRMSGMNLGPVDWDEIQAMIGRGEVRLDDQVQREGDARWQTVRDVLPKSGGDAWLGEESLADPDNETHPQPRPQRHRSQRYQPERHRSRSKNRATSDAPPVPAAEEFGESAEPVDDSARVPPPLAPQFYIMRDQVEVGPLPRQAIQELADDGLLPPDTPVRLEDASDWSTAKAIGFRCSASVPEQQATETSASIVDTARAGGFIWFLFAPFYYAAGVARSIASVEPRRLALWAAIILIPGILAVGWFRSWSQTALRGVVTLDGAPVDSALVQLTGALTGDSAMGITGGDGSFRLVTLDGELKPGLYLVTVRPVSEVAGTSPTDSTMTNATESALPTRYRHINTTDATIEVTGDQSRYSVELTTQRQAGAGSRGFQGGDLSASHALP